MINIVFAHLYNDRSGSPRVLASVIDALDVGNAGVLFIGSDGQGTLDNVGVPVVKYRFQRSGRRWLNALVYLSSQAHLFLKLLLRNDIAKDAIIYVNTIMPFGAALFGLLTGRRVIYHLHEVSITPRVLLHLLLAIAKRTGDTFLYVSRFHMQALPTNPQRSSVLFNAVDSRLYQKALEHVATAGEREHFTILMLASPRDYKGIPELLELARELTVHRNVTIELVVNSAQVESTEYFEQYSVPANVRVHGATATPEIYYANADLVLNLSRVDQWVETFGLTLIEAMAFGIPVIAPPVGGPSEIVRDGVDGYLIDSRDAVLLYDTVKRLILDRALVLRLGNSARARTTMYTPMQFENAIREMLKSHDCAK